MSFTFPRIGNIPRFDVPASLPFPEVGVSNILNRARSMQEFTNDQPRYELDNPNYAQLTNFTAQMNASNTFARPNRFRVEIMVANLFQNLDRTIGPPGYNQNWAEWFGQKDALETANKLMFYCHKAEIPGMTYQTEDNRYYGSQFKVPYMPQYNDIDLEFYVGDDMFERWFFEGWMNSIMDPQTQDFNYVGEYSTNIDIIQMSLDDRDTYWVTLLECYPIAVNQMDLSWDNNDEIHKLSVTFTYKRLLTLDVKVDEFSVNNDGGRDKNREQFRNTVFRPRINPDGNNPR